MYRFMSELCSMSTVTIEDIKMKNAEMVEGRWIKFQVIGKQKLNPWFSIFNWSVFNWAQLFKKASLEASESPHLNNSHSSTQNPSTWGWSIKEHQRGTSPRLVKMLHFNIFLIFSMIVDGACNRNVFAYQSQDSTFSPSLAGIGIANGIKWDWEFILSPELEQLQVFQKMTKVIQPTIKTFRGLETTRRGRLRNCKCIYLWNQMFIPCRTFWS